jgi:hypothetical protein
VPDFLDRFRDQLEAAQTRTQVTPTDASVTRQWSRGRPPALLATAALLLVAAPAVAITQPWNSSRIEPSTPTSIEQARAAIGATPSEAGALTDAEATALRDAAPRSDAASRSLAVASATARVDGATVKLATVGDQVCTVRSGDAGTAAGCSSGDAVARGLAVPVGVVLVADNEFVVAVTVGAAAHDAGLILADGSVRPIQGPLDALRVTGAPREIRWTGSDGTQRTQPVASPLPARIDGTVLDGAKHTSSTTDK